MNSTPASRPAAFRHPAILAATAFGFLLVAGRAIKTGQPGFAFLAWNTFLAWIPLLLAVPAARALRNRSLPNMALVLGPWILFLPNAPYLFTDLVHWRPHRGFVSWYDGLMLVHFAWLGLVMTCHSVFPVVEEVRNRFGAIAGHLCASSALALASYGIYLGRFERWNSWDVVTDPDGLARSILGHLAHPYAFRHVWMFCAVCSGVMTVIYFTLTPPSPNTPLGAPSGGTHQPVRE